MFSRTQAAVESTSRAFHQGVAADKKSGTERNDHLLPIRVRVAGARSVLRTVFMDLTRNGYAGGLEVGVTK